jgi:hypothetical protein
MKKLLLLLLFNLFFIYNGQSQVKKFCYSLNTGKYVLSLHENDTKKVSYDLYTLSGSLQKTMQGTWMLRDEGVYGPAYVLTISWTGLNANMPSLKYNVQYDGNGNMQSISDVTGRTWYPCQ